MSDVYAIDVSLFFMHPFDENGKAIFYQWAYNTFLLDHAQKAKDRGWCVLGCAENEEIFQQFVNFYGGYELSLGLQMINIDLSFDQDKIFEDGIILRSVLENDSKTVKTWLISAYQGLERESYPSYKNYIEAFFENGGQPPNDDFVSVGGPGKEGDNIMYISPVAPIIWDFPTIEKVLIENFG